MNTFDQDLSAFFSEHEQGLVIDPDKFKTKLNIGFKAYSFLSKAENLAEFSSALASGVTGSGLAIYSWYSSLGILGKAGLLIGVGGPSVGWIAAAGVASASVAWGATWLGKSVKKKLVKEVPNYINTPLDVLGASILDLIGVALVLVAKSDSEFSRSEQKAICEYFQYEWGMNPSIVDAEINTLKEMDVDELESQFRATLSLLHDSKDISNKSLTTELLEITSRIALTDGIFDQREQDVISKLEAFLVPAGRFKKVFKR